MGVDPTPAPLADVSIGAAIESRATFSEVSLGRLRLAAAAVAITTLVAVLTGGLVAAGDPVGRVEHAKDRVSGRGLTLWGRISRPRFLGGSRHVIELSWPGVVGEGTQPMAGTEGTTTEILISDVEII